MSKQPCAAPAPAPEDPPAAPPIRRARLRLHDSRVVCLARVVCANDPALRAAFLAGRWTAADLARLATAAVALAIAGDELRSARRPALEAAFALRLGALLAAARPVAGGFNSLAEHLGGRAGERLDRLVAVRPSDREA